MEELERRGIKLLTLPINDRSFVGIKEHFPVSGAWIREALRGGGKVLVNCFQGASRSHMATQNFNQNAQLPNARKIK